MKYQTDFLKLIDECRPFVKESNVQQVKTNLENKESFVLIDVREDHEWTQGHIPSAIHMARGIIEFNIEKILPDKNATLILYCAGGFRSILSAFNLQKMGYTNVMSMNGGISDWLNHGYKLEI